MMLKGDSTMDFNFKSSGKSFGEVVDIETKPKETSDLRYGFQTPLRLGDDLFKQHNNLGDYLKDNLKNLIMTNPGERIGRGSTLGIDFDDILFGPLDQKTENTIMTRIKAQTKKHLPFVNLRTIEFHDALTAKDISSYNYLRIVVHYDVPLANIQDDSVEVTVRSIFDETNADVGSQFDPTPSN